MSKVAVLLYSKRKEKPCEKGRGAVKIIEREFPAAHRFVRDYLSGKKEARAWFDYDFSCAKDLERRYAELRQKTFPRQRLCETLTRMNASYGAPREVMENIEKLTSADAVAVVGGQQAGVLGGPLYTLHKCLTLILYAQKKERQLRVPVVPLFWIAGEDHDFSEINHVYIWEGNQIKRLTVDQAERRRRPVSDIPLDKRAVGRLVDETLASFGETAYTRPLMRSIHETVRDATTYTDFFARLLMKWFGKYGLILLDSNHPELRRIEAESFYTMINHNEKVQSSIHHTVRKWKARGYADPLALEENSAHLFYKQNDERILLYTKDFDWFEGKNGECLLSKGELLHIAETYPESLSNNVVTRPLMQEWILPTLAFIAGPGELAYWACLKDLFHQFGNRIPPLVPRLSLTWVDRKATRILNRHQLSPEAVFTGALSQYEARVLKEHGLKELAQLAEQTKDAVGEALKPLLSWAEQIDLPVQDLAHKNRDLLLRQIDDFTRRAGKMVHQKEAAHLQSLRYAKGLLFPHGNMQERIWNACYFLNLYGSDWIANTLEQPLPLNGKHHIVLI